MVFKIESYIEGIWRQFSLSTQNSWCVQLWFQHFVRQLKGEKKHKSDFKFEENISLYQTSLLHHCINGLDFLLLWCYSVNQIVGAFEQDIYIYIYLCNLANEILYWCPQIRFLCSLVSLTYIG